jgi:hypothetical protein
MESEIFDVASKMALMQAEGYRQVREQARREALEEAAIVAAPYATGAANAIRALKDKP